MTRTIVYFDVQTQVFGALFPSTGVQYAARRGLRRIYESLGKNPLEISTEDPRALYAEVVAPTLDKRTCRDELSALRHLYCLPETSEEVATRIWQSSATLADVISIARVQPWRAEAARAIGAMERFARLKGLEPASIPAVERQIKRALGDLSGPDFGIAPSSYATLRSRILRAVRLVDRHGNSRLSAQALSGPWRTVVEAAQRDIALRGDLAKIWPLISYCFSCGIEPEAVNDDVVADFHQYLERQEVVDPFNRARASVYAWERLQRHVGIWPRTPLKRLYRMGHRQLEWQFNDLPLEVRALWSRYADAVTRFETSAEAWQLVVDPEHQLAGIEADLVAIGHTQCYSPATVAQQRSLWVQCAGAFHGLYGHYPSAMAEVATRDVLAEVIRAMSRRQQAQCAAAGRAYQEKSSYKKNLATSALAWARFEGADEQHMQLLEAIRDRVDPHLVSRQVDASGKIRRRYTDQRMGERHRRRLEQFRTPIKVLAWYQLPDVLVATAQRRLARRPGDPEALNLVSVALLHRILRCAPLRRANLAALRVGGLRPQVALPRSGRGTGRIEIDWVEVKNSRDLTVELDPETVALVRWWIQELRPRLMSLVQAHPDNPHLFPAKGMDHRAKELLNNRFVQLNKRYAGLVLNLHLCRHLTAKIVLDQDPTQIELVQNLLGHKRRATTESYYAEINDVLAQRRWQEILSQAIRTTRKAA